MIDERIKQSTYRTQFCLKLPQSSYDSGTEIFTPIDTIEANVYSVSPGTNLLIAFAVVGGTS